MEASGNHRESEAAADLSRNYLWMSPELRERVAGTRLIVVGCGGNGTLAAVQALHLGFRDFFLCDGDRLELVNLNRHVIAKPNDVGRAKTEILREYMETLVPDIHVREEARAFPCEPCEHALAESGRPVFVLGCLDNVHVRLELDVMARKHKRTLIDLGSGFVREGSRVLAAGGQVLISRPDGPCLLCLGFNEAAPRNDYYLPGIAGPEPSALLLNGIIANLAIDLLLREMAGASPANSLFYDREGPRIQSEERVCRAACPICGPGSAERIAHTASPPEFISA